MSVSIRIVAGELSTLDGLQVDALLLPFYAAARQPRGPAGLVDWRLSGRLARLLQSGKFQGKPGEAVLMSSLSRIPTERLILVGLGMAHAGADKVELRKQLLQLLKIADDAQVKDLAIAPPEPINEGFGPKGTGPGLLETVGAWLSEPALGRARISKLVLLDSGGVLEAARASLIASAKEGGATLE